MPIIESAIPVFFDLDGEPLDDGYVFIGAVNLNPEVSQVSVYWDPALTQLAAQPFRTIGGMIVRNGTVANVYTAGQYSITVRDKHSRLVMSFPDSTYFGPINIFGQSMVRPVNTISDLRLVLKTSAAQASVLGYYAPGDGGGGAYWYDASDTTSADNGGTTIVAADGGRWKLRPSEDGVSIKQFGAKGDGVTDDRAAIQKAIDTLQTGRILFTSSQANYISNGTIVLTDANGHNFQGNLIGLGGIVQFTNGGSSVDTDIAMQRGFVAYPVTNGAGGDITGMRSTIIEGMSVVGPAHGSSFHIANSQGVKFLNNITTGDRYGLVTECCIHTEIMGNKFLQFINAGLGMLFLNDTTRIWYTAVPATGFWNDSPYIVANMFAVGSGVCKYAGIIDHGSRAEGVGQIDNNLFYTDLGAPGTQMTYGYLCRNANRSLGAGNWFENVPFPIRVIATNAVVGAGTNIPYVTADTGVVTYGTFPDGYSYFFSCKGAHFVNGVNDIDFSGVNGIFENGPNLAQGTTSWHLVSTEAGAQLCIDAGDTVLPGAGYVGYRTLTYNLYYRIGKGSNGAEADPGIGVVGEYIESVIALGSALALTTATVKNITSITLTAGDWEIGGNIAQSFTGATVSYVGGGVATVNNSYLVDQYGYGAVQYGVIGTATAGQAVPTHRRKLAATTTLYLNASANFTVGTVAAYGAIWARRVR